MKKVFYVLSAFAVVALFASCAGGVEKDAQKVAKKACECMKMGTGENAEENMGKMLSCVSEMEEMGKKMEEKYKSEADQKAFEEAAEAAMKKECPEVADMF